MKGTMELNWGGELEAYGARSSDIVSLVGEINADHLEYLDLVGQPVSDIPRPAVVVQCQRQPLLYVYPESSLGKGATKDQSLRNVRRLLAMRGDAAMVAIHRPGRLDIYTASLYSETGERPFTIAAHDSDAPWFIPRLAQGTGPLEPANQHLAGTLFSLLDQSAQKLAGVGISPDDCLSLTGRAMFLRFLLDRGVLPHQKPLPFLQGQAKSSDAFVSSAFAAATCQWLDSTFNGDLLPLSGGSGTRNFESIWKCGGSAVAEALSAILRLDSAHGGGYQGQLDWGDLNLAHIPVGLLSQVYERHMEIFHSETRRRSSAYYTPRHIVELMVDEAFFGLENAHAARVLDPAAGAGVFLVTAFHKLVEERWRHDGRRPDRKILKHILNRQICGFDINPSALRLAALSLYLTRLELDPNPYPAEALKFDALQGSVLYRWLGDGKDGGSLGPAVGSEHDGAYDVVIGNPPWTALGKGHGDLSKLYSKVGRRVAISREIAGADRYENPDGNPDLPFVWRAAEWARPEGRIAFALHGRLLFRQSDIGIAARNTLFQALNVSGILNGAALSETEVWPNMDQPFFLLFAHNRKPTANDTFFFVSPYLEPVLNEKGRMRIDSIAAEPIHEKRIREIPWLLKGLSRGNGFAVSALETIQKHQRGTIESYWRENGLVARQGFKLNPPIEDSGFLLELKELPSNYSAHPFLVMPEVLQDFPHPMVHRKRKREIYRSPLVLVRKGFRHDRNRGRALLAASDVAFKENYYGLSCAGHSDPEGLAAYLLLVLHSDLYSFFVLMTSSEFGIERAVSLLPDTLRFPLPIFEEIDIEGRSSLRRLAQKLVQSEGKPPWRQIDKLIYDIYGISPRDRDVIEDTLETATPRGPRKVRGLDAPTVSESESFCVQLQKSLAPFFSITERRIEVRLLPADISSPWRFIEMHAIRGMGMVEPVPFLSSEILERVDSLMVSRIMQTFEADSSVLRIGILNQYRYWTRTQAYMLVADILRNHAYALEQGSRA
ncbi:MAG: SAM-dependent methyltransferase [Burkholderiaceae bacterium]|nr:SAM-dependent methyltransferase [Sulfuritalea sp.]MCF8174588.1 SAM-dependent methyltransferase [Burkholderiaceae bacterium]MCF8184628.1 SAM-dependent methyltransferase [Polynucleobacter sp.]